jgi:hypothetical protein
MMLANRVVEHVNVASGNALPMGEIGAADHASPCS